MNLGIRGDALADTCLAIGSVSGHCSGNVTPVASDLVDVIAVGIVVADDLASREIPILASSW